MTKSRMVILALMGLLVAMVGMPAAGASQGGKNLIKARMVNSGVEPNDRGLIEFVANKAQSFFQIKLQHMAPGATYDVSVDGTIEESLVTEASGEGRVIHRTRAHGNSTPLPYDPRGHVVDISSLGTVVLTSNFPSTPQASRDLIEIRFSLTPETGVAGKADARFRSRSGRMKFNVEMEDAAAGTYDLLVGGGVVGQITVDATGRGQIDFDTIPDSDPNDPNGMDLLMTFDPRGQAVSIQLTGADAFTGTFPLVP